jgi:hypothetical protein
MVLTTALAARRLNSFTSANTRTSCFMRAPLGSQKVRTVLMDIFGIRCDLQPSIVAPRVLGVEGLSESVLVFDLTK